VILNGTDEDVEQLKTKMQERRRKAKEEKKAKKRTSNGTATITSPSEESTSAPKKKSKLDTKPSTSKTSKPGTSGQSSTLKVPELSKFKTVAEDPKASKTYKSLFTSGAPERPAHLKAHWVTFRGRP